MLHTTSSQPAPRRRGHRTALLLVAVAAATLVLAAPAGAATIWAPTDRPGRAADPDRNAVELGLKFRSDVDGVVTGVRFYKSTQNTGTHVGNLWTSTGTNLARATFANETASGWQQVNFAAPVAISANSTYVVSYFAPVGRYASDVNAFATAGKDSPPLHALRNGVDGPNGVFRYGAATGFPTSTDRSTNYWVDVVFSPQTVDTTAPTVTAKSPADGATNVATSVAPSATFSEPVSSLTVKFALKDPAGQDVPGTMLYDAASRTARFNPASALAEGTAYTATVSGAQDATGNTMTPVSWSFTTARPATCPCTLWPDTAVPGTVSTADGNAVELGVRFRSDNAGFITALRFYKGAGNSGPHAGNLWTDTGTLLASATFSNESATGWQQVTLPAPVPVQANTTYVASYHTSAGFYSSDNDFFATAGVDAAPLHAPQDGVQGANGVYKYGASGFPSFTFRSTNYWVDVVFDKTANDTTPPTLTSRSPAPGSTSEPASTSVIAKFSEPVQASTISMSLTGPAGAVTGTTSYDASSTTATFTPSSPLAHETTYTASVSGAADPSGNVMSPVSWSFTTSSPPPPPPEDGPGGPVLLVTSSADPFTKYYAEILRAEGINAFDTVDISSLSAAALTGHDVVLLADVAMTAAQVTTLTDYVTAGGSLIAMRPDPQLGALLGITPAAGTLSDRYLAVEPAQEAAAGITPDTMQFHGTADNYTLSGATRVATLYSSATAATANPAVTTRSVGPNGGSATAFTYDLARSIVLMRQGNPAWAGLERDGNPPIRSDDLFFGGSLTDWVNLAKAAIPQADEQQRLLANLIVTSDRPRMPLPRFWYFPDGRKAVVVATGDDHGNGGTAGRYDQYAANSPAGCSVADWRCLRFTSYIYASTPLSNAEAQAYDAEGFETGLHQSTGCANFTPSSLANDYSSQLTEWRAKYSSLSGPVTNRTHCIVWTDWASQPVTELANGIRLDTNYYYWPGSWIANRPGFMTGSGMPMRFAKTDGTMVDVYQAATQMTDESGQTYPFTTDALLDGALGPKGYYGAFTANMHTDSATTADSDGMLASAQARGVAVVTARQMLRWLDGRNGSSFKGLTYANGRLTFSVAIGAGARGLTVMLPTASANGVLSGLTLDGAAVTYRTETIKGLEYALFPAAAGTYAATYATPTAAPTISALTVQDTTATTATVSLTTDRATTSTVEFGTTSALGQSVDLPGEMRTRTFKVSNLKAATKYFYRITTRDPLGRAATSPTASFATAAADPAAPALGNISVEPLPDGTATVTWSSDQASEGGVDLGTSSTALTLSRLDFGLRRAHAVTLAHLSPGRSYFFRVLARNATGAEAQSTVQRLDVPDFGVADSRLAQWRMGDATGLDISPSGDGELRLADGATSGAYVSRILDAEQMVRWGAVRWNAAVPAGATVKVSVRTGSTRTPDASWSDWYAAPANGALLAGQVRDSRFLQYRIDVTGSAPATPVVRSIGFTSSGTEPDHPTENGG